MVKQFKFAFMNTGKYVFPVTRRCRQKLNESNHVTLNKVFFSTLRLFGLKECENWYKMGMRRYCKIRQNWPAIFSSSALTFLRGKRAFNMTNTKNCSFKRILLQPIKIYIYTCCYRFLKYGKIRCVNNVQNIAKKA